MRMIFFIVLFLVSSGSAFACSCWNKYLPSDHPENPDNLPHFVFKAISGDLVLPNRRNNKEGNFSTIIEVVDSGTTNKEVGERINLIQKRNVCIPNFIPPYQYKYVGESNGANIEGGYCNIKRSRRENDEENFEKWLSNQKSEGGIND